MDRPDFSAAVEAALTSPALLDYLRRARDDRIDAGNRRLLNDQELDRLELIFGDELDRPWVASEPLHRRYVETLPEVRDTLSRQAAEDWSEACAAFASRLENRRTRLSDGIAVIREWVGRLRTLLRVMGAVALLPAPEGGFPTPTCPEPPQRSCPPEASASGQDEQSAGSLRAMLAETQALQREVRDLLVSQKTVKDFYTTAEVATMLGKAEFTVREWCRHGRVHAKKQGSGRGKHQAWVISHEELRRLQREGLLPAGQPD